MCPPRESRPAPPTADVSAGRLASALWSWAPAQQGRDRSASPCRPEHRHQADGRSDQAVENNGQGAAGSAPSLTAQPTTDEQLTALERKAALLQLGAMEEDAHPAATFRPLAGRVVALETRVATLARAVKAHLEHEVRIAVR